MLTVMDGAGHMLATASRRTYNEHLRAGLARQAHLLANEDDRRAFADDL